ncbi:MAG: hypothetical protein ACAH80_07710 [Alphaproteobacteria bacterium]
MLIEPSMAILPSAEAARYDALIKDLERLRARMNLEGMNSLSEDEKAHVILVAAMETEHYKSSNRIVGEAISARANSPKLSDRFLCAVWPPYLGVKPTHGWVKQKARSEALQFYDANLAAVNDTKPQDYSKASVLEGNLRVRKPLTLKGGPS